MQETLHDVVIVGAGPVGLTLARALGLRGHDVRVLERWPEPYALPRAVHFDDEIGRIFQSLGLSDEIRAVSAAVPDHYEWRNASGEPLVRIDWSGIGPSGWPTASFFSQPELEQVLADAAEALPGVSVTRGAEVVGIEENADDVLVTFAGPDGDRGRARGRFVVGCDGANSFVRECLGVTMHDQGFFFDWLIVDTVPLDDREWSPQNWQLCDPARPTTIVSGGPGRRRWEFMRLPGEDRHELDSVEKAWELLAKWERTPDNTTIERHAVYTFAARWADQWCRGRLAIAGDAAHQMPPFAGQGMCSGLRDVANLSWKLDRVLRGASDRTLLDSYTPERSAHIQHAIAMSVELGRVICVLDEQQAAERDARMIAGGADPQRVLPVSAKPVLGKGITCDAIDVEAVRGTLAPQFPVQRAGTRDLLDELTGYGTVLLISVDAPAADPAVRDLADAAGIRVLSVGAAGTPELGDPTGAWTRWFGAHGISAVLIRPDHYVFGAIADHSDLTRLVTTFLDRVRTTGPRHAATA
ncbi:bifunctional 3-(3-hydroxy-phenyl)propionate/3-hydroxycinnamic acid hydroxylase MhpA [Amycolatopsis jiangsuensis]|uniref:2-polyprenyl-6-methoxyphenol hydroxylase-like FAD-dependent oxidoreductase n=1 Tax=Amycolatopsis jiangsuensis TaxID=1181879 RepID=A0A840IM06_9PSEU|nr:bifunctional 3-(3-hydroxy-phenyl)propionate/3-hydroxycinnamic acid hydroxylase [Amycolatopsis jiangsuensis]MBB4682609.1 2-polyprenyl-6-methoxyphenol hydroxylase-like FAD-dependent oxidoreductase [Amycolatopsis jiangsuensis]